jgi:hypothetical protein
VPETLRDLAPEERERLAGAAGAALARCGGGDDPQRAVDELELLEHALRSCASAEDRDGLAYLFGERLRRELELRWALADDGVAGEPVLRYRDSPVVFYPLRMVRRQLAATASAPLALLLQGTREYLANLQRYALGERRPPSTPH